MNAKIWKDMVITLRAKEMAWADLDKDDQRIYLREAEKEWNKKADASPGSLEKEINDVVGPSVESPSLKKKYRKK